MIKTISDYLKRKNHDVGASSSSNFAPILCKAIIVLATLTQRFLITYFLSFALLSVISPAFFSHL